MSLFDSLTFNRGTPPGIPSPRTNSSRANSPRANSPRTNSSMTNSPRASSPQANSPRTEDALIQFARVKMPGTLHLVQRGQDSPYFKLIEKTFQLLNDLQFHCLPLKYRSLGIKHYIATETDKRRDEMEAIYNDWIDKEQAYIEQRVGSLEELTAEQQELIPRIRQSIFTALYHEQDARKKQDPFQPFFSICNAEGQKNASYHASLMQAKTRQQTEKTHQERIKKITGLIDDHLAKKGIHIAKLQPDEKRLVQAAKIATVEARLKASYDETTGCPSDTIAFEFEMLKALSRGSPFATAFSSWEEVHAELEASQAKQLADKKWAEYSKKEESVFEELHGFAYNTLSEKEKAFYNGVRAAIYRVIYEEQAADLPFHSIYNKEGDLNEDYWIDKLDALAKKNRETPLEDHYALKHYTDYDVLRTNTAPPKTKADGITDDSRLRTTGAITPDFCAAVLTNIKQYARTIKQRVTPQTCVEPHPEANHTIFNAQSVTTEEKILFLLDEYCEALGHTHYIRGHTQMLLTKMNIKVLLGQPSLSGIIPTELRKSRKSDADKTPGLLRKVSGNLAGKKIESPSIIRKSPNPDPSTPAPLQGNQAESEFEKECHLFQEELKAARKISQRITEERVAGSDDGIAYFRIYAISLKIMSAELKKLSNMLQDFAASLQTQIAARQERNSSRITDQYRRNSSLRVRPRARPLVGDSTFEPPLRARSVSLMGAKNSPPILILPTSFPTGNTSATDSTDASPPDSPRVADMNPEKFAKNAALLLKLHTLFTEAHEMISAEVEKASPDIQEANITGKLAQLTL